MPGVTASWPAPRSAEICAAPIGPGRSTCHAPSLRKATIVDSKPAAQAPPSSQLVLSDAELGTLRGGEEIIVTNQTLEAITSGNLINGDYTAGSVSMSDNALSNFNGIGNLVINTGAQVSLQSGMNLTITVGR